MFDIAQLNQSSFRGIPFYTKDEELSGGQRLTDHSFINGGTKTETNGVKNKTFTILGYIGGDDYLTQKQLLVEAFETIESGELIDKFHGTLDVFVDTYKIKESITKFGFAEIEVAFKKAENQAIEEFDIVYSVDTREEIIANFENDFNNRIGNELLDEIANDITVFWNGILDTIKFIEDERDELQLLKDEIGGTISKIKTSILSIESLSNDIINILETFDDAVNTELFGANEQKSLTNNMKELIDDNSTIAIDNQAKATADRQTKTYANTVIAGLVQTSINNLENVEFDTGDDFGSVKSDILSIMEKLEEDIVVDQTKSIEEIETKQNLLDKYHESKREFIQFYTQKYSRLQNLKDSDIVITTDILNLTMDKYNDIARVNEVLVNNNIVDPLFISGNIKLLDR